MTMRVPLRLTYIVQFILFNALWLNDMVLTHLLLNFPVSFRHLVNFPVTLRPMPLFRFAEPGALGVGER